MNKYELLCIFEPNTDEEKRNQLLDKFKGIVETDGEIENVDEWGLRKLAYEINKVKEGYYVLINFTTNPDVPKELDRNLKIADEVIRHMIIRIEE
ncbi:30S ribosomal protein S6 [Clostridium formicaceticum]|uniref:Small ribosomal subunit protein bS6 n=1 Tax=Clostridium formicaceticum TaxID=1497 RepID=A0AAC9RGS2_9CLOT|nr:30S ribosomal protein S6 [Clostridium formicaceticum]AOY75436.1 30S ribosomal protein S6 [Clostridium formicaceticum]ARE85721.1 30S ribosomal protein S6 [Clostridium formicaceticum]